MRCPKCQYVSFEGQNRCRNCGYDFSLSQPLESSEPPARAQDPRAFQDSRPSEPRPYEPRVPEPAPLAGSVGVNAYPDLSLKPPTPPGTDRSGRSRITGRSDSSDPLDLPLFGSTNPADDRPLVTPAYPPRPPLAVRRTTEPARPRPRTVPPRDDRPRERERDEEPRLELDIVEPDAPAMAFDEELAVAETDNLLVDDEGGRASDTVAAVDGRVASWGARLFAGLIDAVFLAGVDALVLYFTLRMTDLTLDSVMRLPLVPLVAFLALLNGGYLTMFTAASGQTIGKMLTGIKVVGVDSDRVPFGHAVLRAAVALLTILPAGVGWLPALFSTDRRALHDRLANTLVVAASDADSPSPHA